MGQFLKIQQPLMDLDNLNLLLDLVLQFLEDLVRYGHTARLGRNAVGYDDESIIPSGVAAGTVKRQV